MAPQSKCFCPLLKTLSPTIRLVNLVSLLVCRCTTSHLCVYVLQRCLAPHCVSNSLHHHGEGARTATASLQPGLCSVCLCVSGLFVCQDLQIFLLSSIALAPIVVYSTSRIHKILLYMCST